MGQPDTFAPPPETLEGWAFAFLREADPLERLATASPDAAGAPLEAQVTGSAPARRVVPPPRPAGWRTAPRGRRSLGARALLSPAARAKLLHTFLHHELQAAELFAHAFLAFPGAPEPFRRGLLGLASDELRHARLYQDLLSRRGVRYGDLPVRDWFWERAADVQGPAAFLAWVGLGLEGANLDHTERFAARLAAAGDGEAAAVVARVGEEEIAHVRFATRWFARFAGGLDFERWSAALPAPWTPKPFVWHPMARAARGRAGFPSDVLDALERVAT